MIKIALIFITAILGIAVPSTLAIECYRCNSKDDPKCDKDEASGPATPATDCFKDPKNMLKDWVLGSDMNKYGLGIIHFDAAVKKTDTATSKEIEGTKPSPETVTSYKNITVCAYLFASTENKATETVDKTVNLVKNAVGEEEGSTTVHTWVKRDCAHVYVGEGQEEEWNQCQPIDTKGVFKIFYCTCVEDGCNEGPSRNEKLGSIIKDTVGGASLLQFHMSLTFNLLLIILLV